MKCKNCRATIPLLKTRWLCKKDNKRVLLTMEPNEDKTGVVFGIQQDVPKKGAGATLRANDKKLGAGTMSKAGAKCPCCPSIMKMEDIRIEGKAQRIGQMMTAVVVDGSNGKEYRLPADLEVLAAEKAQLEVEELFSQIPFGLPDEETPGPAGAKQNSSSLRIYGFYQWKNLFTNRQLLTLGIFIKSIQLARKKLNEVLYPSEWVTSINSFLAVTLDRLAERNSSICHYDVSRDSISGTFQRYAFPINWDFCEAVSIGNATGSYEGQIDWVCRYIEHALNGLCNSPQPSVVNQSSTEIPNGSFDVILTDPPYYDAIAYSDLMDFFYVWLRRLLVGSDTEFDEHFHFALSPKWNYEKGDGELIDNPTRFNGDKNMSKRVYEDGMARVFESCCKSLKPDGRLVVVFAHKHPNAWETLVSAIIRAGFVVDGSWPIQTEMGNRTRALSSAALSSSVWLVCKKRPATARPGWDNRVLDEMQEKISDRLRDFWDAGIRGPDFVWAATGPAMEAYSKYPAVKKANGPGQLMAVSEFLSQVRRLVLEFVVGRVLSLEGRTEEVSNLDDITTYYLLHRHDFGMEEAQIGACILYAIFCGLSDTALADQFDILARTKGKSTDEDEDYNEDIAAEDSDESEESSGSKVKLKTWMQRKRQNMGYEAPGGRVIPLIDQIHRLMHLWKAGDVVKVDEYLSDRALRNNALFQQVLQSLIELSSAGSDERALLESISNHIGVRGKDTGYRQTELGLATEANSAL